MNPIVLKMDYNKQVYNAFLAHSDQKNAEAMKAYMRGQYDFFGVKSPQRKEIEKVWFKETVRPSYQALNSIVKAFWQAEERELQLYAMELIDRYKKEYDAQLFDLLEFMIINKSWWDTVDYIASNLVGVMVKKFPEEGMLIIDKWRNSENLWLIRTSILFQLKYKDQVNETLLYSIIDQHIQDPTFLSEKLWVGRFDNMRSLMLKVYWPLLTVGTCHL